MAASTRIPVPVCEVTLGAQRWTGQLLTVEIALASAPLVGVATVRLPPAAAVSAVPSDSATVTIDGADVMRGTVTAVRRGLHAITVTVLDAAGALARSRPATTYEKTDAGTVIRALAGDAGVPTGDVADGVGLAWYAADPSRTALEHVARLAAWSGATAYADAGGSLVATVIGATEPQTALRYGREVLSHTQVARSSEVEAFTVAGEAGAGDGGVPEALRPTSDFFAGNRPAGPDGVHRWGFAPALRTTTAAATAGAAARRRYVAGRDTARLTAWLQPSLRPGSVIQIADLPDPPLPDPPGGGPYWLDRVTHRISARGAVTTARLVRGGPALDPLAAAAGAAAGLLTGM
ncbi:hypothetical protein [Actinomadura sp. HBU206391]|uniref:hypothetical protein n=1 Tax=Actinomadura sp. HBU206391 TaxID=2731692 RepID=UPI00164F5EEB|nr:hypothetical protein [Actinomadura sp. HBU206391]MBC6459912.1 hypothetical protein [Actinomadura sp. HBU206391]